MAAPVEHVREHQIAAAAGSCKSDESPRKSMPRYRQHHWHHSHGAWAAKLVEDLAALTVVKMLLMTVQMCL
jgi:hypothetical protein